VVVWYTAPDATPELRGGTKTGGTKQAKWGRQVPIMYSLCPCKVKIRRVSEKEEWEWELPRVWDPPQPIPLA